MKNLIIFLVLTGFGVTQGHSQTWHWASKFDEDGMEIKSHIGGIDKYDNCYLTVETASMYHRDPWKHYYLLKYDSEGTLVWSEMINEYLNAPIVTDREGRSYLAAHDKLVCFSKDGELLWLIDTQWQSYFAIVKLFNGDLWVHGSEYHADSTRTFVAIYDVDGQLKNKVFDQQPGLAAVTSSGDFYLASPDYPHPVSGNSGRLRKYNPAGNLIFTIDVPYHPKIINCDNSGNVIIHGSFGNEAVDLGGTKYTVPKGTFESYKYLVKYDAQGNLLWYKIISGFLGGATMNVDSDDNLYYAIQYSKKCQIEGDLELESTTSNLMVLKYSPEGQLLWKVDEPGDEWGYASPRSICLEDDEIWLSGTFRDKFQFGDTEIKAENDTYTELFVARIKQETSVGLVEEESGLSSLVKINPNPSAAVFSIHLNNAGSDETVYRVTDVQGRNVLNAKHISTGSPFECDLSAQPCGLYFLEVRSGTDRSVHKLVKQ